MRAGCAGGRRACALNTIRRVSYAYRYMHDLKLLGLALDREERMRRRRLRTLAQHVAGGLQPSSVIPEQVEALADQQEQRRLSGGRRSGWCVSVIDRE